MDQWSMIEILLERCDKNVIDELNSAIDTFRNDNNFLFMKNAFFVMSYFRRITIKVWKERF